MIPSLRYLCLEKVIAQNEDYADLPEILVNDINLMKVFNGTYSLGDWWESVKMKIFYDGKVWKFKSRTWYHESDGEGEDGWGVCYCKNCWDTTGSNPIDITVKDGEIIEGESCLLDFLGISIIEQDNVKLSAWRFEVDLQSNDDKHPDLLKHYDDVKSLGAIAFNGVGQGESTVCGRFQVEVFTHKWEDWLNRKRSEERKELHREVTGSVNNSELYSKNRDGYEPMHVSWWKDPETYEIRCGVNSILRIESDSESESGLME